MAEESDIGVRLSRNKALLHGTIAWAELSVNGLNISIVRGHGALAARVDPLSVSTYVVSFNRGLSACAHDVTMIDWTHDINLFIPAARSGAMFGEGTGNDVLVILWVQNAS